MNIRTPIAAILTILCGCNVFAQSFLDDRGPITLTSWKFYKGDVHSAESGGNISEQGWEDVTVPHTWNAQDILTNGDNYYRGIGWYRTSFDLPKGQKNMRYFVRFEGAQTVAEVYVNGTYIGRHKGGFSAFCFEITSNIRPGRSNRIAVKVDNSMQPDVAPSGTHLYPLFGGIYRPVTVFCTNQLCISPLDYASSGIYIKPQAVSDTQADIEVTTLLDCKATAVVKTTSSELLPPAGHEGTGLYGQYFANPDFKGEPKHTRVDEEVSFDYGSGSAFEDMPKDGFSVLWTGRFIPQQSGLYKFVLTSDDGSRLYLNDSMIIDNWGGHAPIEKWGQIELEAGKEIAVKIEYNETGNTGMIMFGWTSEQEEKPLEAAVKAVVTDDKGTVVVQVQEKVKAGNDQRLESAMNLHFDKPHLWNGRKDPYNYTLTVTVEDAQGNLLDKVQQPLGLRYFEVDTARGLLLNGQPYHLHGVCRHQEWEGIGAALTDASHEKDIEYILEVGANGVRLAHYQQAEKMYSLCDENGLVVWAEIPNTPMYRVENPAYLQNCKDQLTELIKQNYNHPSILFWGMYNEIPIPAGDVQTLHDTAKGLDPARLTTQADFAQPTDRHWVTDVVAWNWYFGWYYDPFNKYTTWYDSLHEKYPQAKGGLSEYGAGGCITQQQDPPVRPEDPTNGKFFPEQYQRLYHEEAWKILKDREDVWCKFIWNMFDFSWTSANRGDRPYINHKGLMTHDRKVKKDAFYFYKANWSEEPVLYILSRRNTPRTVDTVEVSVYTNLNQVELYVDGKLISSKPMDSDIHKITWADVKLQPGRNQISVIGVKGDAKYTDACEWTYSEAK